MVSHYAVVRITNMRSSFLFWSVLAALGIAKNSERSSRCVSCVVCRVCAVGNSKLF